jgi:hypothetical protein
MDASLSTEKVYAWRAYAATSDINYIQENNNVIFGDFCWKMYRTTDTGGVKLIFNGAAENGQCLDNRGNHVGFTSRTSLNLAGNFFYGTDYNYDAERGTFSLAGDIIQSEWNAETIPSLYGRYTCCLGS